MRKPWSRKTDTVPPPGAVRADESASAPPPPLVAQVEEAEPIRVLDRPERLMGYVEPDWISPVTRQFVHPGVYPRLSPYFEHREYLIFVEARPWKDIVSVAPAELRLYEAGNIWGMCYSANCRKGEEGHHHLSMLRPISPERFAEAQAAGWDL